MEASVLAIKAGTDLTCGREYRSLVQAVKDGRITEGELDTSLKRLMTGRFRLGMFDPPEIVPYARIPFSENDSPGSPPAPTPRPPAWSPADLP